MGKNVRFRMDFEMEILSYDEVTGLFQFQVKPRDDRYEWRTIEGKKVLYDRLDELYFPESVIQRFAKGMKDKPIGFELNELGNFDEYLKSRIQEIEHRASGKDDALELSDKSGDFLESLNVNKLEFAILSIDMIDSSVLSNTLDGDRYQRLVDTFVFEMSAVVPRFHGYVLKYTGDGLIAYFPAPSFIVKNDLAFECALILRRIVYLGLNPVFSSVGLPTIGIRIGLDSGEAYVRAIGSPSAKRHKDIIGEILNLATKIQGLARPGGVCLGDETYRNLHTVWRLLCVEKSLPEDWKYKDVDGSPYKVFEVQLKRK